MKRLLNSFLLTAILLPAISKAQETIQLSLEESIEYALEHQVKMKNALLDQKSSLARNRETVGLALPNLQAKGGITYAPLVAGFELPNQTKFGIQKFIKDQGLLNQDSLASEPDFQTFAFQQKWTSQATAELSQILFDPSVMVALQARKKLEELAQRTVDMTRRDLKVEITKAYYDVLIAEKQKALIDKNVQRISDLERETREIYNVGLAEKIDVDRITVTLNNLKTQQTKVKQLVDLSYMSLKFQIGMALQQPITLTDELIDNNLNVELLSRPFDYNNRIEFQLQKNQRDLLKYDLKRYKLGWLPTIAGFGSFGYTQFSGDKLFNKDMPWQDNATLGVNVTVPLFDGFQRRNKAKQAKFAYQKAANNVENIKSALELEKINAQINLRANLSNLDNQKSNMKLAGEVYDIAKTKYKEGVGSSLEVMNAETSLKEAQTNYFNALYDAINARINLLKALGEL